MELSQNERCEYMHVHEDIVAKVEKEMPDDEILFDLAELFKIFGDSTRIKILYLLFESEMCVCDIAQMLRMTQSAISHQLAAGKIQAGRQDRVLLSVRRSCKDDHRPGNGTRF